MSLFLTRSRLDSREIELLHEISAVSASEDKRVVRVGALELEGLLSLPEDASGLVIFAHGSGSSRLSPRNTYVAERLQEVGLGTLLFDLLTEREEHDRANVFDIPLLAERVEEAVRWARQEVETLPVGVFGSSTGAAAALIAAAQMPDDVSAVVSRGGRVDLADTVLDQVRAPTLFIVGGADYTVLELNEQAFRRLACEKRLDVVPGATHLFEEPGALDKVIDSTAAWFSAHLGREA